jgi:hypothetical protein
MMKFLRNAILLCLNVFPQNYIPEEAVLVTEELFVTNMKTCEVRSNYAMPSFGQTSPEK